MKRFLFWGTTVLLLAAAIHIVTAIFFPRLELEDTVESLIAAGKVNTLTLIDNRNTLDSVLPGSSNDLAIAICPYNIEAQPISISAPLPNSYWSISVFGPDGQNIYTLNDKQVGTHHFSAMVMRQTPDSVDPEGSTSRRGEGIVIRSTAETGVVIFRAFVPDRASRERANSVLSQIVCKPTLATASTG